MLFLLEAHLAPIYHDYKYCSFDSFTLAFLNMQISGEKQMFRTVTAKFTSSQTKYSSSQSRKASAKTTSSSSLIEILKRSSEQSSVCNHHNDPVDLSHVMATFRIPKKQIKGVLG